MKGIELLARANVELAGLDLDSVGDDELGELLVGIEREQARLAATKARVMATFETRRAYRADGSKTAAAWLARETHCSPVLARALGRLGRRLRHMPATRIALTAGRISERHAEILGGLYESPRKPVADAFGDAESMLVGFAIDMYFDDFVAAVRHWMSVVDADGAEDQAAADHASRYLHLSQTWRGSVGPRWSARPHRRRRGPHRAVASRTRAVPLRPGGREGAVG